jgi:hypothetical protein
MIPPVYWWYSLTYNYISWFWKGQEDNEVRKQKGGGSVESPLPLESTTM